jgi:hypothetical protein
VEQGKSDTAHLAQPQRIVEVEYTIILNFPCEGIHGLVSGFLCPAREWCFIRFVHSD